MTEVSDWASPEAVTELRRLCCGREVSRPAERELERLLVSGTEREVRDAIGHLRRLPVVHPAQIDVCDETTELVIAALQGRHQRQVTHVHKIRRAARALGRRVARHEVTLADAEHRLDRLVEQRDLELDVDVRLIPISIGRRVAEETFAAAFHAVSTHVA